MGNGQCHECFGNKPNAGWWTDTVGHKKSCKLAAAIASLGSTVDWERENFNQARIDMAETTKMMLADGLIRDVEVPAINADIRRIRAGMLGII